MNAVRNAIEAQRAQWQSAIKRLAAVPLILALFLFLPAGTINWTRGWLFVLVLVLQLGAAALLLCPVNPEIFAARSGIHEGTKHWDRVLLVFLFSAMFAIPPVAALDDGRFHWSQMSWWVVAVGYLLFSAGMGITAWALREAWLPIL